SGILEKGNTGWGYLEVLAVSIPASFLGIMCTAVFFMLWDKARGTDVLSNVPEYQRRLEQGLVKQPAGGYQERPLKPGAKRSVLIFLIGLVAVLAYAILISPKLGLVEKPAMDGGQVRIATMLTVALLILVLCKADVHALPASSIFRTGMTACVCILGVAWLGTTFMDNHQEWIKHVAGDSLANAPWLLAGVLIVASALLYSQAATAKALLPTALAIGIAPSAVVACFPAVSALYILAHPPPPRPRVVLARPPALGAGHHHAGRCW
ncbi:MAG: anaerobic C4-dicarboxylate transporter family protein, partial [Actinomyces sp.]|uniref:anaerobic C4-dicarboxylate transporter family protein n=1 Tax=Actinomyces sp. TaxID=29317 RepID=UPI0026DC8CAE